jgi:hypothetical protein
VEEDLGKDGRKNSVLYFGAGNIELERYEEQEGGEEEITYHKFEDVIGDVSGGVAQCEGRGV